MPQTNQHDIVVKRVLSEKKYAIDLLQNTLDKAIADKLDFTKLKMEQGSFIDAKDRERFTDLLFSIPHKQKESIRIYALIEHKSHPEKTVLCQLLSYLAAIYSDKKPRTVVIPIVLYHGQQKWKVVRAFSDLLDIPEDLSNPLRKYIPDFTYELIDLSPTANIQQYPPRMQAFLASLKEIWYLSKKEHLEALFQNYLRSLHKQKDKKLVEILLRYFIQSVELLEIEIIVEFADKYISKEAGERVMTIAEQLEKKGIEQGIEKGEQKKAIATARLMLSKGYPLSDITEMTGLTGAQLREAGLI